MLVANGVHTQLIIMASIPLVDQFGTLVGAVLSSRAEVAPSGSTVVAPVVVEITVSHVPGTNSPAATPSQIAAHGEAWVMKRTSHTGS